MCNDARILFATSAAYYEKGDLDKCREDCLTAVEVGRANKCEFKLLAK